MGTSPTPPGRTGGGAPSRSRLGRTAVRAAAAAVAAAVVTAVVAVGAVGASPAPPGRAAAAPDGMACSPAAATPGEPSGTRTAAVPPGRGGSTDGPPPASDASTTAAEVFPDRDIERARRLPDGGPANGSATTAVTLITGQTVYVTERNGTRRYLVDADVSMQQVRTPQGTYVFPVGTDFSTFDIDLFNVDLLIRQGLTDAETDTIPVIVEGRTVRRPATDAVTRAVAEAIGDRPERTLESIGAVADRVPKAGADRVSRRLATDLSVEKVHLDARYEVALDEASELVNATVARENYGVDGSGVTVAVLDTGVDETHPAIGTGPGGETLEKDFTGEGTTRDRTGHGTHVAGIVTSNDSTYTGIAPGASIWDLRVLGSDGSGLTSWIIAGMEYATDNGADVISMSLGGGIDGLRSNSPFADAVAYATANGTAVVVAAGNGGPGYNTVDDPGVQRAAITVGASDKRGGVAAFSSRGPTDGFYLKPDLVAPGANITSTAAGTDGFVTKSGTSMATPVVAGAAALLLERHPGWGPERLKTVLVSTADGIGADVYTQGTGRLNVSAAVDPAVVIDNATVDFGRYHRNTTVTRTVTVTNLGDDTETLNLSASAVDVIDGDAGRVRLNRTTVTLGPGEQATVALTVVTGADNGLFSGRLVVDGDAARASFGWARAYRVTVDKTALRSTSVDGDPVTLLANHSGAFTAVPNGMQILDGGADTVTFSVVSEGEYVVGSSGIAEDENQPVFVSKTVTVTDGNVSVTLDEAATTRQAVDVSALANASGRLMPVYLEALRATDAGLFSLVSVENPETTTIRVSADQTAVLTSERVLVPAESRDDAGELNASTVYYLVNVTDGVAGDRTRFVKPADLGRKQVTYARAGHVRPYDVTMTSFETLTELIYATIGLVRLVDHLYTASVGERTTQTVYVSPTALTHTFGASAPDGAGRWQLREPFGFDTVPEANDTFTETVNDQPLVGYHEPRFDNDSGAHTLTHLSWPQQSGEGRLFNDSAPDRLTLWINGTRVANTTFVASEYRATVAVTPGAEIVQRTVAHNDALPRSTRTVTTTRYTYRPGGDSDPPWVVDIDVRGLNATTTAPNGSTAVTVMATDPTSNVTDVMVLWAPDGATRVPFDADGADPGGAWTAVEATNRSGGWVAVLNTTGYAGNVSLAVRIEDAAGNIYETTTFDAVAVRDVPPTAAAAANETVIQVGEHVRFDGAASRDNLGVTGYAWDVDGDGTTEAVGPETVHAYDAPGTYSATLTVTDTRNLTDTATATVRVIDTIDPTASLSANTSAASVNETRVRFAAAAADNHEIAYYLWDFDDDGVYEANTTSPNVTHVYRVAGEHDATVTAVDPSGNTANATWFIDVGDAVPPTASLTANRTTVNASRDVGFDAAGSSDNGAIARFEWDVDGDGTVEITTDGPTLEYAYAEPGRYELTVTVVDTAANTVTANLTVTVVDEIAPTAAGSLNATAAEINATAVGFDATATADNHEVAYYLWDVDGDGVVEVNTTTPTLAHVYDRFGVYTPTVTAVDPAGNRDTATLSTVTVRDTTPPRAVATANVTLVNRSDPVTFDASASTDNNAIAGYAWDLDGDGDYEATGATATTSFPDSGTYTVTVTVTDENGTASNATVTVEVWDNPPSAAAGANTTDVRENGSVALNATASTDIDGDRLTYWWTQTAGPRVTLSNATGARPTFRAPNVSGPVTLTFAVTVTDEHGKADTATVSVTVVPVLEAPTAVADYRPVAPNASESVTLDGVASTDSDGHVVTWAWDVDGDGINETYGATANWSFSDDRPYNVTLTVVDDEGTTNRTTVRVDVANAPPTADAGTNDTITEGTTYELDATDTATPDADPLSYRWVQVSGPSVSLRDANRSTPTFVAPSVDATRTLVFKVVVTDDDGATDVAYVAVTILDAAGGGGGGGGGGKPATYAQAGPDRTATVGEAVRLSAAGSDSDTPIISYEWELPDGSVVTGKQITVSFDRPGTYFVTLTVTDERGATATDTVVIVVEDVTPPTARVDAPATATVGEAVTFDAADSSDNSGVERYEWTFPDGSTATGETVTRRFNRPGTYTVRLTVVDEDGNTATTTVEIVVRATPTPTPTPTPRSAGTADRPTTTTTGSAAAATRTATATTSDSPGFGPVATLVALVAAALLARRRD